MVAINGLYLTIFPMSEVSLSDRSHWVIIMRTALWEGPTMHFGFMVGTTFIEDLGELKTLGYQQPLLQVVRLLS